MSLAVHPGLGQRRIAPGEDSTPILFLEVEAAYLPFHDDAVMIRAPALDRWSRSDHLERAGQLGLDDLVLAAIDLFALHGASLAA